MAKKTPEPKAVPEDGIETIIANLKERLSDTEAKDVPHKELLDLLPTITEKLGDKRDYLREQANAMKEEVSGLRDILPADEEEEEEEEEEDEGRPTKVKKVRVSSNRGGNRGRNPEPMVNYCRRAANEAGKAGLTKVGFAKAIKKLGFSTPVTDIDEFAKSVYVSGIMKMKKELVWFRNENEREGRYRLKKFGK